MTTTTKTTRTEQEIVSEMQAEGHRRNEWNNGMAEGARDGYNPHEDRLAELSAELAAVKAANSPLVRDLAGEKAAFNAQRFTSLDLQKANAWCLARGYSLSDLQAAAKAQS